MSYGGYGRANPFEDQEAGYTDSGYDASAQRRAPPQAAFGQGPRPGGGGARYNQGPANSYGGNVEMTSLSQNGASFGNADPNAILNECRDIDRGIDQVEQSLNQIKMLQDRALTEADTSSASATSRQLDGLSSETMSLYRTLTERVRTVKSNPESRQSKNAPQVSRIDRRLKQAIQQYQQVESSYRKKTQDQMARQYRIVRPDADETEVRAAVEDASQGAQVFQQALLQSGRQGQARAVLSAVQDRQAALQKIEQQMIELAQLFQDMDTLVLQQDVAVTQIEAKGEEVVENLDKGNEQIGVAVETARKTRRKKWWCLGICVAIILVIVLIVIIYMAVTGKLGGSSNNGSKKRSLTARSVVNDNLRMNNVGARAIEVGAPGSGPISRVYAQARAVVPNAEYIPGRSAASTTLTGGGRAWDIVTRANAAAEDEVKKRVVAAEFIPDEEKVKRFVVPGAGFHETSSIAASASSSKEKRFVVPGAGFHETSSISASSSKEKRFVKWVPEDLNG